MLAAAGPAIVVFSLLLPGVLVAWVFLPPASRSERVLLGSLLGIFCVPFLCFGSAMLLGTAITVPLILGVGLVLNASLGAWVLLVRRRRRRKNPPRSESVFPIPSSNSKA